MNGKYPDSVYQIWLAEALGAGSDYLTAVTEFESARGVFEASEIEWRMLGIFTPNQLARLSKRDLSVAARSVQICSNNGWHIIAQDSEYYPVHLKNIKDSPALLYVNGDPDCLTAPVCISVVGAREASNYGKEVAFRLAASLVKGGATVVSGGALGIDSASHEGAISAGGKTVAVMGCGLGAAYLPENEALRNSVSKHGAVISEYLPLSKPTRASFPMRNRIISGMSLMTVVIEAGEKSGSLGTAKHAAAQGRDVGAVPGDVISSAYIGSNVLISNGAKMITSAASVLEDYVCQYPELIAFDKLERTLWQKPQPAEPVKKRTPDHLSDMQKKVYELIGAESVSYDYLIINSSLEAPELSLTLTELELEGLIVQLPGSRYKIS
ncbi:MAG: DNA-processing protein DprA [Clostridia bacterium]|nr:DNA-processing protein DprA [Clostridia bacterium]